MAVRTLTLLAALSLPGPALAGIVRCVAPDGAVTYQQVPCEGAHAESRPAIPAEFPPVNVAERDRLLAREAALDRRLEARRDRETQEAVLREARELERARLAAIEAQSTPQYVLAWPAWGARPGQHRGPSRPANLPVWAGGNPLSPGFSR